MALFEKLHAEITMNEQNSWLAIITISIIALIGSVVFLNQIQKKFFNKMDDDKYYTRVLLFRLFLTILIFFGYAMILYP